MPGGAYAFPDLGASCAACHGRPDGNFDFVPSDLLQISPEDMGEITFDVTDVAAGVEAAISLVGLDAAGLMATPDLTNWTQQTDGTDTWLTSDTFNTIGPVVLNLTIGAGATLGNYPIAVTLAGGAGADGSRWSTMQTFAIEVIPEPTTMSLLGVTLTAGAILGRRRSLRWRDVRCRRGRLMSPD
jgi:hypothetical protein